jgi:hypothetical protein
VANEKGKQQSVKSNWAMGCTGAGARRGAEYEGIAAWEDRGLHTSEGHSKGIRSELGSGVGGHELDNELVRDNNTLLLAANADLARSLGLALRLVALNLHST